MIEADEGEADEVAELLKSSMESAGARYLKRVPVVAEVKVASSWAEK